MSAPKAQAVFRRLTKAYPDARCSLPHHSNFQLLVCVMLSAQCTDAAVEKAAPGLFELAPDAATMARTPVSSIKSRIKTLGLANTKAKNIKAAAQILVDRHRGEVPDDEEALVALPGVGRKTAHVVLGTAFGHDALVVDTHVGRISRLLGLTRHDDPVKVEADLCRQLPKKAWTPWAHLLIRHGRAVCVARRPQCQKCVLKDVCPTGAHEGRPVK
ncbi:MAG: endonuclease III [Planctomycetota bacterium]